MSIGKCVGRLAGWWLVMAGLALAADPFVIPADGPVAFRRDRLPLEVERMRGLSRDLETLAGDMAVETPVQRQGAARMLALALALDPGNTAARVLMTEFQKGGHAPQTSGVAESREEAWKVFAWLRSPEAGGGGAALADCLGDVLAVSAPEDPRAVGWKASGVWKGWVPELSAYESKAVEEPHAGKTVEPQKPLLGEASVVTPLWSMDPVTNRWTLGPVTVKMSTASADAFKITFRSRPAEVERLANIGSFLSNILEQNLDGLPAANVTITTGVPGDYRFAKNKEDVTAAAAVLAGSAATGRKPAGSVIGVLDRKGAFSVPPDFWEKLRAIDKGPAGRLVLPAAAAEYLPAYLAMGDAGFFLRHEVLLASDFKELSERMAETPEGPLTEATAKFSEIVKKQAGQPVGPYLTNRFVRQRLAEISQAAPWHFSAKMLAMQGAGERPRHLPGKVLASELRAALEPMAWVTGLTADSVSSELAPRLDATYGSCEAALERLKAFVDPADNELYESARALAGKVRALSRATRLRNQELYTGNSEITPALAALLAAYREMKVELTGRLGVTPENPEP